MTAYYVPEANRRLLSPQNYLQNSSDSTKQHFVITASHMEFVSEHCRKATVKYHHQNNLPTMQMWNSHQQREPQAEAMEACVLNVNNMHLTPPQKELLHWHFHLCHQGFDSLQQLLRTGHLGNSPLTHAAAKCDDTIYIKTQVFRLLRYYSPASRNIARSDWATQNITHNMTSSIT